MIDRNTYVLTGRVALVLTLTWTTWLPAQQGNLRDDVHFYGDITHAVVWETLTDSVLVGHRYGGRVITTDVTDR